MTGWGWGSKRKVNRKRGSSAGKAGELFGAGRIGGGAAAPGRSPGGRGRSPRRPRSGPAAPDGRGEKMLGAGWCRGKVERVLGGRGCEWRRSRAGAEPRRAGAEPPQAAKRPGCAGRAGREKPRRGSAGWGQTSIWELRRARKSVSQRSWPLGAAPQPSARRKVPSVKVM